MFFGGLNKSNHNALGGTLHCSLKELNKIESIVIFWKHHTMVTSALNCFVCKQLLFFKVRLQINNVLSKSMNIRSGKCSSNVS